jgi:hypothetical protein
LTNDCHKPDTSLLQSASQREAYNGDAEGVIWYSFPAYYLLAPPKRFQMIIE